MVKSPTFQKKKTELCFDIHESLNDHGIQNVIDKLSFFLQPLRLWLLGRSFYRERNNETFHCVQQRLLHAQGGLIVKFYQIYLNCFAADLL